MPYLAAAQTDFTVLPHRHRAGCWRRRVDEGDVVWMDRWNVHQNAFFTIIITYANTQAWPSIPRKIEQLQSSTMHTNYEPEISLTSTVAVLFRTVAAAPTHDQTICVEFVCKPLYLCCTSNEVFVCGLLQQTHGINKAYFAVVSGINGNK